MNGFDTGLDYLPDTSIECRNLLSARNHQDITSQLVTSELEKGYLLGPFDTVPFTKYRINPIGLAEGKYSKKQRLIVDLSSPHNDPNNPSLNDLVDKSQFSLQYVTIDAGIKLIKHLGQGSWLCKADITDAFKLLPIHPSLVPYHGIKWDGKYYFYTRLVFGSRSSPKIFDTLSVAICWIATHVYGINHILHLLDDFLVVTGIDSCEALRTMALIYKIFHDIGVPLARHKTVGPVQSLEYLGITLDSTSMEARLPDAKVERIGNVLRSFITRPSCTKRELLSLLGHLNFACRVIYPGRSFISYLISLSTTVKELHHHVKLTNECRLEMKLWDTFLASWNGVSFFLNDNITEAADMQLYTDATISSFGGFYRNRWFMGKFDDIALCEGDLMSMAFCELYPIVMACVLWGHEWRCKRILFHCDNMSAVDIVNKGRSKVKTIMKLVRRLTLCSALNNFTIHCTHIPGVRNIIADALSRFQIEKFRRLAPFADKDPTVCIPASELMNI